MSPLALLSLQSTLSLVAYGLRIGIRASSRDALDRLVSRLPPGWAPGPSSTVDVLYSAIVSVPGQTRNVRRYHVVTGAFSTFPYFAWISSACLRNSS